GDRLGAFDFVQPVQAAQFVGAEDFTLQPLGARWRQQGFDIQPQSLDALGRRYHGQGAPLAMGDRADYPLGPLRRAILTNCWYARLTTQLYQCLAGADSAGEKLALALGHAARRRNASEGELLCMPECRIELAADHAGAVEPGG